MCFGGFHENVAKTWVLDPYHGGGGGDWQHGTRNHIYTFQNLFKVLKLFFDAPAALESQKKMLESLTLSQNLLTS